MEKYKVALWNAKVFDPQKVKITTLAENASSKEIQILMAKDSVMREHQAPFPINIQVLKGEIWFEVEGERVILNELDMISLEGGVPHSLGGLQDSIVRLSLSRSDSIERVNAVLQ